MASSPVGINTGTTTFLPGDSVGTLTYPVTKIDVGNVGSSVPWQGSVTVSAGTVTNLSKINGVVPPVDANGGFNIRPFADTSTLSDGQNNAPSSWQSSGGNPLFSKDLNYVFNGSTWDRLYGDKVGGVVAHGQPQNAWGTVINSGTSTLGTLKAAVSGSTIYITDLTISMGSTGTVALYNGGTGNLLAGTWYFNANGGIVENYRIPLQATSGTPILYQQQGNTPMSITATGYIK